MTDRHPDDDLLISLALSEIDEPRRDTLTGHLALCEPCRARYSAVADSVDHVMAAAPLVAPPAGFTQSVLAALGVPVPGHPDQHQVARLDAVPAEVGDAPAPPPAAPGGSPPPRPHRDARQPRRRRIWLAAIAAVVALLVGAAGTAVVLGRTQATNVDAAAVGPALRTSDGTRVGTVLTGWYASRPVLVVTLTDGPVGTRYDCQLVLSDGTRQPAGSWVLADPAGATWVIPKPDSAVTRLELVTARGTTWASASL